MSTKVPPVLSKQVAIEKSNSRRANAVEFVLIVLSFVWLCLIGVEFVIGERAELEVVIYGLWAVFVADFAARFWRAPNKLNYLKTNWLMALSLLLPAFRMFRLVRIFRLTGTLRLAKLLSSINRGMRALGKTFAQRGFAYIALLTLIVTLLSASGFFAFERMPGSPIESYGDALWLSAMIMTTMGSDYWPKSLEGRFLCFFLSLYAFGIFGYFTAALASFFIGTRKDDNDLREGVQQLSEEIRELRSLLK